MMYNNKIFRELNFFYKRFFCLMSLLLLLLSACKKEEQEEVERLPLAVTDYYPNSGQQGTLITVEGTGFSTDISEVSASFSGTEAEIVSATATAVVLRAPAAGSTGQVVLKIGGASVNVGNYTYQDLSVGSISPTNGAAGTHVRIEGAGFSSTSGPAEVFINGKAALVVSASGNVLVAEVPVDAGTGPVTIKVNGKEASGQSFKFQVISGIKPATGGKGTRVKIIGGGFDEVVAGNYVDFNGKQALVTEVTETSLTVVAPDEVATGPVAVTINNQKVVGPVFTVVPFPTIESVTPLSGPAGTEMTITGQNFSTINDENVVTINGKPAEVTASTLYKITLKIPGSTGNGKVVLNVNDQVVNGPDFKDQTLGIARMSPDNGLAGTQVTITGTGFSATAALNTVTFNGVAAQVVSATTTSLVVVAPAALTTGEVRVLSGGQTAVSPGTFNRAGIMTYVGGPNSSDINVRDRGASIAVDSHGNLYIMELTMNRIKKVTPDGNVTLFAGSPTGASGNQNGTGTAALFNFSFISGIVFDQQDNMYLTDGANSSVRKITPSGVVSTYAVNLNQPGKLAIDESGILWVQTSYSLTRVDKAGIRTVVRGFNGAAEGAAPIIIGSYLYFADSESLYIGRFDLVNSIYDLRWAGNGNFGNADGPIKSAMLVSPKGFVGDGKGNMYFSDGFSQNTRKVDLIQNTISTVSAQTTRGFKDGGLNEAQFMQRDAMAMDKDGNIYIVDMGNNAIRKLFLK
ncbi:IPT/TIG domain-containing protein [Pedobacter sp. BAL39]|uniref:IPT/TIG domain-containing protein n=1 Tax=Pedobacter sp. BAL39 TaxID=391596 RepID=UPI000A06CFDC|nr:IPT/TIG domain-containing protein [Pedobacter sp. BAL39]